MFRANALAAVLAVLTAVVPAMADDAPDPAKVKRAADEFDLGVASFKAKQYDEAAQHFEAADEAVPGVKTLRLAMRARSEAGEGSRAATLAAQALDRYADDAETAKLAKETLEKFASSLHKVNVSCASPCVLAVGTRAVHGARATRWTIYLDPGAASINASFFGDAAGKPRKLTATAGGSTDLRFEPVEPKKPDTGPVPTGSASNEIPPDMPMPGASGAPTAEVPDQPKPKGLHPAFFGVGLGLTAAAGGVLVWSGVDALTNPGPDTVRQACAGKGTDCPEYQQGLDAQLRTNIMIGVTGGLGAATVLIAIFTRWSSGKPNPPKTAWLPTAAVLDHGAVLGVAGALE